MNWDAACDTWVSEKNGQNDYPWEKMLHKPQTPTFSCFTAFTDCDGNKDKIELQFEMFTASSGIL